MRNAFIDELVNAARSGKDVALVVGDLGYKVVEPFADEFPERFINSGIAEQNMMGLSAGLASEGVHVFVYSIANFPTFRCAEQIRNDVAYHKLPVTIVSVGGGLAYGALGYSHHAVQDYAIMRSLPNMLIAAPGDPMEVRGCMRYLIDSPQPSYLRLGKAGEKNIHPDVPSILPGEWVRILASSNDKNAFLSTGATLELAYEVAERESRPLYSLPMWGMDYKSQQVDYVGEWKTVTTVEDHLLDGGFGSWMCESLLNKNGVIEKIIPVYLSSEACGMVGKQETLNELNGLSQGALSRC
ncbi:MAG: hypothetical protein RIQ51_1374 [Bacteroidota bacterium]